jgi:hypothetical protein
MCVKKTKIKYSWFNIGNFEVNHQYSLVSKRCAAIGMVGQIKIGRRTSVFC